VGAAGGVVHFEVVRERGEGTAETVESDNLLDEESGGVRLGCDEKEVESVFLNLRVDNWGSINTRDVYFLIRTMV